MDKPRISLALVGLILLGSGELALAQNVGSGRLLDTKRPSSKPNEKKPEESSKGKPTVKPVRSQSLSSIRIDMDHILAGRINSSGKLVGMHHLPSAPKQMRVNGTSCVVEFTVTSPGGDNDVVEAKVAVRDPKADRIVAEKFSTLFPSAWSKDEIERAIREAWTEAEAKDQVDRDGKWFGNTRTGVRIEGFLSYDKKYIATAFPRYQRPRRENRKS